MPASKTPDNPQGKSRGGRHKGSVNARTKALREISDKALAKGVAPLEIMLEAMRAVYEKDGAIAAFPLAKEAAPYCHPRLASVEAKVEENVNFVISSAALTDDEWAEKHGAENA